MKTILLTQGKIALVDDDAFDRLNAFSWYADKQIRKCRVTWYAKRKKRTHDGQRTVLMHRELLGVSERGAQVDHKNSNTLDNQKETLRLATNGQNKQNSCKQSGCTSQFKGVSRSKKTCKWEVRVKGKYVGLFENEEAAAAAYDLEAKRQFGVFALTNH